MDKVTQGVRFRSAKKVLLLLITSSLCCLLLHTASCGAAEDSPKSWRAHAPNGQVYGLAMNSYYDGGWMYNRICSTRQI